MAYKQTPGRGNHAKTGHGIPTPFKQMETIKKIGSAVKRGLEAADKFVEGKANNTDSRYHNEDTILGRRMHGTHAGEKVNPKSGSPAKQVTWEGVKKAASTIGNKVKEGLKATDKFVEGKKGSADYSDRPTNNDTVGNVRLSGPKAGTAKNPKSGKASPAKMKVSKKTAYDIKEASNQKLKPSARKHYAENAQAAMKNKKSPAAMKKC